MRELCRFYLSLLVLRNRSRVELPSCALNAIASLANARSVQGMRRRKEAKLQLRFSKKSHGVSGLSQLCSGSISALGFSEQTKNILGFSAEVMSCFGFSSTTKHDLGMSEQGSPKLKAGANLKLRKQVTHLELTVSRKASLDYGLANDTKVQLRFSKRSNGSSGIQKHEIFLKLCLAV